MFLKKIVFNLLADGIWIFAIFQLPVFVFLIRLQCFEKYMSGFTFTTVWLMLSKNSVSFFVHKTLEKKRAYDTKQITIQCAPRIVCRYSEIIAINLSTKCIFCAHMCMICTLNGCSSIWSSWYLRRSHAFWKYNAFRVLFLWKPHVYWNITTLFASCQQLKSANIFEFLDKTCIIRIFKIYRHFDLK